jgi:DNA-binding MarR family transcriptional regulator
MDFRRMFASLVERETYRGDNADMDTKLPESGEKTPAGNLKEGGIHDLLGYQLAQASIPTTAVFVRAAGKPLQLRPVEFTILQLVYENTPVTATKVAKALAVTTPGVTIWLDRLEERGLLVRERSDIDRRAQNLTITSEGRALVRSALTRLLDAERELVVGLSDGERRMLLELLQKVARSRGR